MADMLPETEKTNRKIIDDAAALNCALGDLLTEHKGADVLILDVRPLSDWTDFFIIATATSNTHLDGLERHIKDFCHQRDIEINSKSRKPAAGDDEWRLIDLGWTVVHLMSKRAREFYELERLWTISVPRNSYSSKSSYSPSSS